MITPVFDLSQDDDFVKLLIKTPYVKAGSDFSLTLIFVARVQWLLFSVISPPEKLSKMFQ